MLYRLIVHYWSVPTGDMMSAMNAWVSARIPVDRADRLPTLHKYRVMKGDTIIGQFSNLPLAAETAYFHRGCVVLDASVEPYRVVYKDGRLVEV